MSPKSKTSWVKHTSEAGFSVAYPADWEVLENNGVTVFAEPAGGDGSYRTNVAVTVSPVEGETSLREFLVEQIALLYRFMTDLQVIDLTEIEVVDGVSRSRLLGAWRQGAYSLTTSGLFAANRDHFFTVVSTMDATRYEEIDPTVESIIDGFDAAPH